MEDDPVGAAEDVIPYVVIIYILMDSEMIGSA